MNQAQNRMVREIEQLSGKVVTTVFFGSDGTVVVGFSDSSTGTYKELGSAK